MSNIRFLPPSIAEFLKLCLVRTLAGVLSLTGLYLFIALLSYHQQDPSWNTAGLPQAHNWLGASGAQLADFFIQYIGRGSLFLPLILLAWAWRLFTGQTIPRLPLRVILLLSAFTAFSVMLAGFFELRGSDENSPFIGALGVLIYHNLIAGFEPSRGLLSLMTVSLLFISLFLFAYIFALTFAQWRAIVTLLAEGLHRAFLAIQNLSGWLLRYTAGGTIRSRPMSLSHKLDQFSHPFGLKTMDEENDEDPYGKPASKVKRDEDEMEEHSPLFKGSSKKTDEEVFEEEEIPVAKPRARAPKAKAQVIVEDSDYEFPPTDLLSEPKANDKEKQSQAALKEKAELLRSALENFGVHGTIQSIHPGPVLTLFEFEPAPGTKSSKVIGLAEDIARSVSALSVRVAVIPGHSALGIEIPNKKSETVYLREMLESEAYENSTAALPLILGKDISGAPVVTDLAKMPHLLIAGTTGSGKSVGINVMILSLLYRLRPDQCRLIMVDPKMLELSVYQDIPHLLTPVVTEPGKAVVALKWTVKEMEQRYRSMSEIGVRNIDGYNEKVRELRAKGEKLTKKVKAGFDPETGQLQYEMVEIEPDVLPYIVVIVDEMADLMMVAGKDIEATIQRLAQMARAAGIHIIMATQRPSVDVITGTIKANFPTRISFQVTSKIDSRTILGEQGAEQLLGRGDMLYMAGGGRVTRVHGPFVGDQEVEKIVDFLKGQAQPVYVDAVTKDDEEDAGFSDDGDEGDDLYAQAVKVVRTHKKASTSFIQRHLKIGYNRAATIIEQMEQEGVITQANHVGKREVLID